MRAEEIPEIPDKTCLRVRAKKAYLTRPLKELFGSVRSAFQLYPE
jgi:hypothetical protein